jgi:hypothetical protein
MFCICTFPGVLEISAEGAIHMELRVFFSAFGWRFFTAHRETLSRLVAMGTGKTDGRMAYQFVNVAWTGLCLQKNR